MKQRVAVFGTGRIGVGQATLTAGNGFPTVVVGRSESSMNRCREGMERNWAELIQAGVASEENRAAAMALVTITDDPRALEDCGTVFEAVSEDLSVKREVFQKIGRYCPADSVVASCTSSIPADALAEHMRNPERLLIAHPFQPVHLLPLVEVVGHENTADWAEERICGLLRALRRKVVVLKKCVPGFLVNRLAQALFRESIHLVESGVCTPEEIDMAVKYAVGMRYASMGLLEYFDDVGFRLESAIAANVYPDLCGASGVQAMVEAGLRTGAGGRAEGRGFYDWREKDQEDFFRRKREPYLQGVLEWDLPV